MEIAFRPLDLTQAKDRESLIAFLTSNRFPFHVCTAPAPESVEQRISDGAYASPDHALLGVDVDGVRRGCGRARRPRR